MTTAKRAGTGNEIHRDVLADRQWDARVQPNEIGVSAIGSVNDEARILRRGAGVAVVQA